LSLPTSLSQPLPASAEVCSRWASLTLMIASGFAGLGYQIVWTQQSALWLGHESAAVLAVVAAFFGGLAVGALAIGPRIERSPYPVRWYAAAEAAIALWSMLLALLMSPFSDWLLDLTGTQPSPVWQWTVAFSGTFLLLLPATAAIGATLPAMERVTARLCVEGRSIAPLYAANTFGAVLGVLAAAFWLLPELGLARTAVICIVLNLLCAGLSLAVLPQSAFTVQHPIPLTSSAGRGLLTRLAFTGLLGIGYEVLVVRVLSQVSEDTVYTFAMLLAVYLVGSGLGAAAYQRWLTRSVHREKLTDRLLCALAAACLVGTSSLWASERVKAALLDRLGSNMVTGVGAEAVLALAAFALPTVVMGALFSHLNACASASGISFGRSLGVNTLGAAVAPLLFGVLMTPWLGAKSVLLLIAGGYLALTTKSSWLKPSVWLPAGFVSALAIWAPPLSFVDVPEGGHIVSYREGAMAAVSVVEDADGVARLRINNRQQEGSSSSLLVDARQALLPVLLHPAPQHALFLGLGTGITASSAAEDPSLQVDAVELLPEVIEASQYFWRRVFASEASSARLHTMKADARRYVRASRQRYDVIVSDNFHPARSGSGSLYTVEHFQAVRGRLAAGGVFCQWLPLHQLDLETLRSIVQSFIAAYPAGSAILASNSLETPVLGLIGREDNNLFDVQRLRERLAQTALPKSPGYFGIEDEFALLGSFVAGPKAMARFAGSAAANTDDHPVVAYRAPRIIYAPESLPRDRLIALLHELSIEPAEIVATSTDAAWRQRLVAYWAARTRYIEAGKDVRPAANVRDMLSQVREPLLSVLRISPDFRPAYDPLLRMATSLGHSNAIAARLLLTELIQLQPARTEAGLALLQLASPAD
jgi:spermidine synthase